MESIDAVISWVDGADPLYQEKLRKFCEKNNINHKTAIDPTRINQVNEIYYCLAYLSKNVPWLRKIFLVTNQQTPPAIKEFQDPSFNHKIHIVDQNELLAKFAIKAPVFNSLSVEWLLWSIPGLSEKFLYLNDDFFITRPLQPEDFFIANKIKIRGQWKTQATAKIRYKIHKLCAKLGLSLTPKTKIDAHRKWQEDAAKHAGLEKKFYLLEHAPFALKKSYFANYVKHNVDILTRNASRPFRDAEHISGIPLITHIAIVKNQTIDAKSQQAIMVNGATHSFNKIKQRLKRVDDDKKIGFVCMQSIDQAPLEVQKYMLEWLRDGLT